MVGLGPNLGRNDDVLTDAYVSCDAYAALQMPILRKGELSYPEDVGKLFVR